MSHYSPLVSAFVTLLLTLILTLNKKGLIQETPGGHISQTNTIARTGGISLMAGILSGWVLMVEFWHWWIVLPMLYLFVLSLLDERRKLTAKRRLIGYLVAAIVMLCGTEVAWIWVLPVLLFIIWMTDLYGFMDGPDGLDGLTGGMTLFGFTFYGVAGLMNGDEVFAMMNFSVGAAALGFLYHNYHPAKVFMGKVGSAPLGFLAASFGVWGWQQGYWAFWFPVLVFSPFVADAILTAFKYVRRRGKLEQAQRSYYYQCLAKMGWEYHHIVAIEYSLMFLAGLSALLGLRLSLFGQGNMLVWWGAIYLGLVIWVDRSWRRYEAGKM